jgi:hypothetical protein
MRDASRSCERTRTAAPLHGGCTPAWLRCRVLLLLTPCCPRAADVASRCRAAGACARRRRGAGTRRAQEARERHADAGAARARFSVFCRSSSRAPLAHLGSHAAAQMRARLCGSLQQPAARARCPRRRSGQGKHSRAAALQRCRRRQHGFGADAERSSSPPPSCSSTSRPFCPADDARPLRALGPLLSWRSRTLSCAHEGMPSASRTFAARTRFRASSASIMHRMRWAREQAATSKRKSAEALSQRPAPPSSNGASSIAAVGTEHHPPAPASARLSAPRPPGNCRRRASPDRRAAIWRSMQLPLQASPAPPLRMAGGCGASAPPTRRARAPTARRRDGRAEACARKSDAARCSRSHRKVREAARPQEQRCKEVQAAAVSRRKSDHFRRRRSGDSCLRRAAAGICGISRRSERILSGRETHLVG